ncbi:MAG: hypothetical protein R2712_11850 [Vicinamibacterales bacterium]
MPRDRRTLLLGALVAVAVGALAWFWLRTPAPDAAAGAPRSARRAQAGSEAPLPEAETVRLARLTEPRDEPPPSARNPFQFGSRAAAAPVQSDATAPPPPMTFTPVEPAAPSGPPPPPPIPLKFIGVVQKADGTALAVLVPTQGEGSPPLHGKEGDIIDGRYRILKIGTESIELSYADGRGRQTIRLTGE